MSEDLRRAYLLGDGHSLYGNLPGSYPDDPTQNQNSGYAFAAMPRAYDQNDPYHHGRAGGRPPFNLFYKNQPLKHDGGLNLQEKTWSGATYMLAPCPKSTDTQDTKSLVLSHAIETIRAGNGKWKNKTDCLVNHFNQVLILTNATLLLKDFDRFDSNIYEYTFLNVQTSTYRNINNIPAAGAAQATFRASARYVAAEMTIEARRRFAQPGHPTAEFFPGRDTKTVLFRLPIGPAGSLHDAITTDTLRDIKLLINVCQALNGSPQFGTLEREQFSQDRFNNWVEDIKQQTKFELVAKLMRPAFVGEGIIETPVTRLVQCQQKSTNAHGQTTAALVLDHYDNFAMIVSQFNPNEPYPVNLPQTFFNSLTKHMQDKLNRRSYRHPPLHSTNEAQIQQLQELRDKAVEEERELATQIALIKTTLQPTHRPTAPARGTFAQRPPAARTFLAHADHGESDPHSDNRGTRTAGEPGGDEDPLLDLFDIMQNRVYTEEHTEATIFLSPAETALRNASGSARPLECWGCTGHSEFHNNRFHSFRDCPNRYDPAVRAQAYRKMKQQREEWDSQKQARDNAYTGARKREAAAMIAPAEAIQDWRELGFPTRMEAEKVAEAAALMATNISARNRQHLHRAWQRKWGEGETQERMTTRATARYRQGTHYGPADEDEHQAYHFIAWAFQATPTRATLPLEISPTLPHCQFPIGPAHGKGKLKVALDSCAGVNIGHLQFHQAMAENFPELVASFKSMQEYGEQPVTIGGVEVSATALKLTHLIEYRTPFRHNGTPCNLTFGLSEQAAATAILSINFLRKTKALWSYDDAEPNLHLTIWNTTMKVNYEPPTRRVPPTPQDRFRAEATAVYTAAAQGE
jgi:hypothetical protein